MPRQSSHDRPKKLLDQVKNTGWYEHLATEIAKQQHWHRMLLNVLGPALAEQCYILEKTTTELVLETANSIWASRIRFQVPEMIKTLQGYPDFAGVRKIKCQVRPIHSAPQLKAGQPVPISNESAQVIRQTAEGIDDERLKAALLLLAKR